MAALAALEDAGLTTDDVDGVIPNEMSTVGAEALMVNLGTTDIRFAPTMHTGGASIGSSVHSACMAIAAGVVSYVLVVAGRQGFSEQRVSRLRAVTTLAHARDDEFEKPYGSVVAVQQYA